MKIRPSRISTSIASAISQEDCDGPNSRSSDLLQRLVSFFTLFDVPLTCFNPADFLTLRHDVWQMNEDEYLRSFRVSAQRPSKKGKGRETELVGVGDLGFGVEFLSTVNGKYLVKALCGGVEAGFLGGGLFEGYVKHVKRCPNSLLVRVVDGVFARYVSLGGMLGLVPTGYVVMENLMFGREEGGRWETYRLRPGDEAVVEGDELDVESVQDKLFDEGRDVPGCVYVSTQMKEDLMAFLEADTMLLAEHGAVDYSLFLVRYPGPRNTYGTCGTYGTNGVNGGNGGNGTNGTNGHYQRQQRTKALSHPWRTGVDDIHGQWTYRVGVLDFFWAREGRGERKGLDVFARRVVEAKVGERREVEAEGAGETRVVGVGKAEEYRRMFVKMADGLVVGVE